MEEMKQGRHGYRVGSKTGRVEAKERKKTVSEGKKKAKKRSKEAR